MRNITVPLLLLLPLALFAPTMVLAAPTPVSVTIDTTQRYQTIKGFGTCFGDPAPGAGNPYLTEAFEKAYTHDLGASILRVPVDYDVFAGSLPPGTSFATMYKDMDFTVGDVAGEGLLAKGLEQHKLDRLLVYATPWSPPGFMKANGVTHLENYATGGPNDPTAVDNNGNWSDPNNYLLSSYYRDYGNYLAGYSRGFQHAFGVPIYAVSVQNELMFDEFYDSCHYDYDSTQINWSTNPWTLEPTAGPNFSYIFHDTVQAIGQSFAAQKTKTILAGPENVGPDGSYFTVTTEGYVNAIKSDPVTAGDIGVINTHADDGDAYQPAPDRSAWSGFCSFVAPYGDEIWMTETSGENPAWSTWTEASPTETGAISVAVHMDEALAYGNCSAFLYWQVLGNAGGDIYALTTADPVRGLDPTYNKYCAFKQFSRYIRPGSMRVGASGDTQTLSVSAYVNDAASTLTIVVINTAPTSQPVTITLPSGPSSASFKVFRSTATEHFAHLGTVSVTAGSAKLTMPPRSVVTLYSGA